MVFLSQLTVVCSVLDDAGLQEFLKKYSTRLQV
eukprot:SAG11_NODE_36859_length_259_cov_1.275000_2_plen_33_part_01